MVGKSRYLPVPTMSRLVKVREPMRKGEMPGSVMVSIV